jgi:hypothetical protein
VADLDPVEVTNLDRYGSAVLPWSRPRDLLAAGPLGPEIPFFLGTCRSDGRPHAAGVGAVWHDGDFYIVISLDSQKARNLAVNPACTISARLPGIDLVVDGTAARVSDPATLETLAAVYREGGWPATVEGDAFTAPFSAPSAGPPPWHLFRVTVSTAVGVAGEGPPGATRWRFDR